MNGQSEVSTIIINTNTNATTNISIMITLITIIVIIVQQRSIIVIVPTIMNFWKVFNINEESNQGIQFVEV